MSIRDMSLDAWKVTFQHLPQSSWMLCFSALCRAGVFVGLHRLDTFWTIVGSPRPPSPENMFASFPDVGMHVECQRLLVDMGLPSERAAQLAGEARGVLDEALLILGWLH